MISQPNNNKFYPKYIPYFHCFFISIVALTALYLVYDSWNWKYNTDMPPIRYVAKCILAGQLPYKDVFEFNMPFSYLVHIIILFFSESDLSLRIADLIFQFIGMWGIFRILARTDKKMAFAAAMLFFCFTILNGQTLMLERDLMIACLMPHIIYPFVCMDKAKTYNFIISTLICFCAILIKPIIMVLLALLVLVLIFDKKISLEQKKQWVLAVFITLSSGFLCVYILFTYLGISSYFIDVLKFLDVFSTGRISYHRTFISIKTIFNDYLMLAVASIFGLYFLKLRNFNWYILAVVIYSLFHYFIQKKGYFYHLQPLKMLIYCFVCYVIFNKSKTKTEHYLYSITGLVFILLFSRVIFLNVPSLLDRQHEKVFEVIQTIKKYNFKTIQALDAGASAIEIVERLGCKNKYPFFYNFLLNYQGSERLNTYKSAMLEEMNNGNIDIVIFSDKTYYSFTDQSVLEAIKNALQTKYDSISSINYYSEAIIYKSKKLPKTN